MRQITALDKSFACQRKAGLYDAPLRVQQLACEPRNARTLEHMKYEDNDFRVKLDPRTIEAVWTDHLTGCVRCKLADIDSPATLTNACPEGVQYIKVLLVKRNPPPRRERPPRPEGWVDKETAKRAMKYK